MLRTRVRREAAGDAAAVDLLHRSAFGRGVEADLLAALRADEGWLPRLALVAEVEDGAGWVLAGSAVSTRGRVGGEPALGLGPVAVLPPWQGRGVGTALVHATCAAADALDEALVVLLGDPAFYGRSGFGPAAALGVQAPDPSWGEHLQARALTAHDPVRHRGRFAYAAPFDALEPGTG